jgi:acetylornithine deacetylase
MPNSEILAERAIEQLGRLVAFDTTSRGSNLELIAYVEDLLSGLGVASRRVANADGTKANLLATIGPEVAGGVVLSGHTDVVPVDGQPWTSDPFVLTHRGDKLYGRGTCDMKGFLALALAAAPRLVAAPLKRPVHLAFSYDEEVGCLGAPDLIAEIAARVPAPAAVIVGEPTGMEAISGHKGIATFKVTVTGHEAHSSQTHLGVSANMAAIGLMAKLVALSERLAAEADPASLFTPKGASLTIGQINGGTAVNILARECVFAFDLRTPPGVKPGPLLADFFAESAALDAALKARFPQAGVLVEARSSTPAFAPEPDGAAEAFARRLAGDNGPPRVAPYAAEAGQFQEAGYSTVICGPGYIDQAHQPDEYVEVSQMQRGAQFMARLIEAMAED